MKFINVTIIVFRFIFGREHKEIKRSLTRAPELLRLHNPPSNGTQKGDVYSFGVMLYEIYGRKGPFGLGLSCDAETLSPTYKEILEKLRNPPNPLMILRPPFHFLDAPECVKQSIILCWNEDPEDRPDMRLVRIKLKELQGGL
jgi:guanylate cyclase, other